MPKTILLIGAFDVKSEDYNFVRKIIEKQGCKILTMNWGVFEDPKLFPIDISSTEVAKAGGAELVQLQRDKDRGAAMKAMAAGVAVLTKKLFEEKKFDGVLGLGGSGGTSVITSGMRAIPIGVPKVMVSTVASGDTSFFVGLKDITMIPSIVDIAGVNLISEKIFTQAAGAICGMVNLEYQSSGDQKPIITATMFGQTTPVVNRCREILLAKGYEVLIFHASGTGGRTMESMIAEGLVYAVLDITTTEWADEIAGGILSAGKTRLEAPGKVGIPHLIVPGCIDMVNFGPPGNGSRKIPEPDSLSVETDHHAHANQCGGKRPHGRDFRPEGQCLQRQGCLSLSAERVFRGRFGRRPFLVAGGRSGLYECGQEKSAAGD